MTNFKRMEEGKSFDEWGNWHRRFYVYCAADTPEKQALCDGFKEGRKGWCYWNSSGYQCSNVELKAE